MKLLILGAAGETCSPATKDIIARGIFSRVTLADLNIEKLRRMARVLGVSHKNVFEVDARNPTQVKEVMQGHQVVINGLPKPFAYDILQAALQTKVSCCYLGSPDERILSLDEKAKELGLGGIKQFRVYLFWKLLIWEVKRFLLPGAVVMERPLWEGNRRVFVNDARVRQVGVFVFLYLVTYMLGTLILCASGYSLSDSLFEFASAVGTVGISVGVTRADMPDVALWAETLAMFLGRLEFLVVFTSVIKLIGDGRHLIATTLNQKEG